MPGPAEEDEQRRRDAARLADLEARLGQRKTPARAAPGLTGETFNQANLAWRMVIELVAGMVIGFVIGWGLDRLLGTMPVMLVLFVLLGFAAGVKTMMRTAREIGSPPPGQAGQDGAPAGASKHAGPQGAPDDDEDEDR